MPGRLNEKQHLADSLLEQKINTRDYLTKSNVPASDYVINPYVGCTHACRCRLPTYNFNKINAYFTGFPISK